MKLLLITFVICFTATLTAPVDKQKREILPGDPRYGTDYHHHHHHHHENDNEVQISKAAGGYVGSFSEETNGHSLQVQPLRTYGPPNFTPGKPLGPDYAGEAVQNTAVQVPATSYGVPDTQINNNYVEHAIEDNKASAVVKSSNLNIDYQAPSAEAPITSYVSTHEEHLPQTSYGNTVVKSIHEQPQVESVQQTVVPRNHEVHHVHHEVQPAVQKETISVPQTVSVSQVKATTSHEPVETQGVQHSVSSFPSFTSSISSFPNFYSSYPSFSSIPVRTLDHRVQVQVPQPYPVPVTKHVTYPVPIPHAVEVPKPYYVRVAQPVQVTVNRPYAVEVPRAVPYPVPQYVRTSVPIVQQHISTLDTKASNPIEGFFENAQSAFQNVVNNFPGLPTFSNPLENFQNPFQNFPELPSFPSFPSFPSLPSLPSQSTPSQTPAPTTLSNVPSASSADSVTVENPVKTETTVTKTAVAQPVITHHTKIHTSQSAYKPTTSCAGCSVVGTHTATNVKEHAQSTDTNGYNY